MKKIKLENLTKTDLKNIAEIIRGGGIVLFPFDTVYGLMCDPRSEKALRKIFEIKKRNISETIGLAVSDTQRLTEIADLNGDSMKFVKEKTPGPFTFIVKAKDQTISRLCQKNDSYGIRIPDSPRLLDIIQASGGVVAQTSANISGKNFILDPKEIFRQFSQNDLDRIDYIIDGGKVESSGPSSIIDLTGDTPALIERK